MEEVIQGGPIFVDVSRGDEPYTEEYIQESESVAKKTDEKSKGDTRLDIKIYISLLPLCDVSTKRAVG